MKRKLLSAVLATVMVASLVGCGGGGASAPATSEPAAEEPAADAGDAAEAEAPAEAPAAEAGETKDLSELKLAFIVGTMNDEFYQNVAKGITTRCDELGIPAPTVGDQELDGIICTNLVESYVSANYDAIALSCNDKAGIVPAFQNANAAGVQMFTFDCTLDDQYADQYHAFVGTDNYAGGVVAGEYMLEVVPDGTKVGCITYASAQSTQDRQRGFEETIDAAIAGGKDIERIETMDADNDQAKATDIMNNWATKYGDELSYIFVVGDPTGYGALAAIKSAGAATKIIGFDANATALDYIASEDNGQIWVADVAQDPVGIGSGIVDQMAEYFTTGAVTQQTNLISPALVTKDNVDDYR